MSSGWIGVDLDGTLAQYGGWKGPDSIGPPIPAMLDRVRRWLAEGKEVRVFTARACIPEQIPPVRAWLDELGLERVGITNVKDFAMAELWDDRAVQVVMNRGEPVGTSRVDTDNGWRVAPDRYTQRGRETIDRMRDLAHEVFGDAALADQAFAFYCLANALKYEDRAGTKGNVVDDLDKARWYASMTDHAIGNGADPRQYRPGFIPWARHGITEEVIPESLAGLTDVLRRHVGGDT